MDAFHTLHTASKIKNNVPILKDYEIVTLALSALSWKKHNGSIYLCTDTAGAEFVTSLGLDGLWDEVRICLDDVDIDDGFWAGGKIKALSTFNAPVCMIDLDFIVWREIAFEGIGSDVAVVHTEPLDISVYPDKEEYNFFLYKKGLSKYKQVQPVNTAFTYINNVDFINRYTSFAMEYMTTHKADKTAMLFVEQRLFGVVARSLDIDVYSFSTLERLFQDGAQKYFTHLWGLKKQLDENTPMRIDFIKRCQKRLLEEYNIDLEGKIDL